MAAYFASRALLADGWAHDVRLEVDAAGMLTAVTPGGDPQGCTMLSGPVVPGMPNSGRNNGVRSLRAARSAP